MYSKCLKEEEKITAKLSFRSEGEIDVPRKTKAEGVHDH